MSGLVVLPISGVFSGVPLFTQYIAQIEGGGGGGRCVCAYVGYFRKFLVQSTQVQSSVVYTPISHSPSTKKKDYIFKKRRKAARAFKSSFSPFISPACAVFLRINRKRVVVRGLRAYGVMSPAGHLGTRKPSFKYPLTLLNRSDRPLFVDRIFRYPRVPLRYSSSFGIVPVCKNSSILSAELLPIPSSFFASLPSTMTSLQFPMAVATFL